MKKLIKQALLAGLLLLFAGNAWAFPIKAGDTVKMLDDWHTPYQMQLDNGDVYKTFCVEQYVYFTPGNTYEVASVGDTNTDESKWLMATWLEGGFGDEFTDLQIQQAIWDLEEGGGDLGMTQTILALADNDFTITGWDIRVVHLFDENGVAQSQMVAFPVPEPATMVLFGIGLIGLAGIGRRKVKK